MKAHMIRTHRPNEPSSSFDTSFFTNWPLPNPMRPVLRVPVIVKSLTFTKRIFSPYDHCFEKDSIGWFSLTLFRHKINL